jgi:predicted ATP-dependent serine protease
MSNPISEENSHLSDRAQKAAKIIASPRDFKVCEGCDSIVAERAGTCPNCHAYRFNDAADAVVEQARLLATREQTSVTVKDLC